LTNLEHRFRDDAATKEETPSPQNPSGRHKSIFADSPVSRKASPSGGAHHLTLSVSGCDALTSSILPTLVFLGSSSSSPAFSFSKSEFRTSA
jgi:hypothetical protein